MPVNNTKNVPHDPKFQQRLEKQEQRDHRTEHIFRRVLHVIERVIAAKRVFSKDYMLMPESDLTPVACDFDADTVVPSAYHPIRFSACPVAAFGTRGEKIVRDFTPDEIGKMTAKNGGKK
jgi:hypothetical protein